MTQPDADDLVQQDAQKVKDGIQQYRNGGFSFDPIKTVEGILWSIALGSGILMVVALPWVGQDKLISGEAWIGLGSLFIIVGIFGAVIVRQLGGSFADADRSMSQRFKRGR